MGFTYMGVNSTSDTDLLLLLASSLVSLLNLPNSIEVTNSRSNLMLILNEWVFFVKLDFFGFLPGTVQPSVVDGLGLSHELLNTIDGTVVIWLVVLGCLADQCIVQDVSFIRQFIFFLTFINNNLTINFLNLNVP